MKYKNRAAALAVVIAITPHLSLAADAAADAPAAAPATALPGVSDLLNAWGVTVSGEFAASYYHSNGYPGWDASPVGSQGVHGFDSNHDSFSLDEAGLQIGYQPKQGIGGFVDVIAGEDAKGLHYWEDGNADAVDVRQAYLQYATGPFTIIAGKYVTAAGAEVINPALNTNFSRSLLFWNLEPLTHTGARVTWAVSDTINVFAGVNNGWNYTSNVGSGSKTGEFGATWAPNKTFSLAATSYFGKDDVLYNGQELSLVDFVGTYNVTSSLTLMLNADFKQTSGNGLSGTDATTHTNGFAGYVNYSINDNWRVSVRGEYLDYVGTGHLSEGTLTVAYSPAKNFEVRAELRYDKASSGLGNDFFLRTLDGSETGGPTYANSNTEFALQGVYHFSLPPAAN